MDFEEKACKPGFRGEAVYLSGRKLGQARFCQEVMEPAVPVRGVYKSVNELGKGTDVGWVTSFGTALALTRKVQRIQGSLFGESVFTKDQLAAVCDEWVSRFANTTAVTLLGV